MQTTKTEYHENPNYDKTNHSGKERWTGAEACLKLKNLKLDTSKSDYASLSTNHALKKTTTSILDNPNKLDTPRLQINENYESHSI